MARPHEKSVDFFAGFSVGQVIHYKSGIFFISFMILSCRFFMYGLG